MVLRSRVGTLRGLYFIKIDDGEDVHVESGKEFGVGA